MSYGIDTLKVGYKVEPSDIDLRGWNYTSHGVVKENDEDVFDHVYDYHFPTPNGTEIYLKFVPTDYKRNSFNMVFIEFSLPKLILGCNYQDIDDWQDAVRSANTVIATIPGLPVLPDIQDATLYRIDACANLQVGEENVSDYIQALQKGHHPHRTISPYGKSGVIFRAREVSTCIYDKFLECRSTQAKGILRYEISMRTRWEISKWTQNPEPTLRDVTKELVRDLLLKDMGILHLDTHMVCDHLNAQVILSKKYSPCRVQHLLGYLILRRTMTVEQLKQEGYTPAAIRYNEKLLAKAGFSSLSIDSQKTLPALTLLLEETGDEKNYHKVPSDTRISELDTLRQEDSHRTPVASNRRSTVRANGWQVWRSSMRPRGP